MRLLRDKLQGDARPRHYVSWEEARVVLFKVMSLVFGYTFRLYRVFKCPPVNKVESYYAWTGALDNLEEAIQLARQTAAATSDNHPMRPNALSNLANMRAGVNGLGREEAIKLAGQAAAAMPDDHPERTMLLDPGLCLVGAKFESKRMARCGLSGPAPPKLDDKRSSMRG
ncbi:hypothetical protein PCL_12039 [Purpureocillium lilacinum]|uniref:Uncharacterized protein n=1 Tax=Purpureocillium lilacinum TaxID=33203 RepID=A0A2U3DPM1_PURLI|nr:hypothetical protein PCL_12039 [Purpureocillium lilacinum]